MNHRFGFTSRVAFAATLLACICTSPAFARPDSETEESPLYRHIADMSASGMSKKVWRIGDQAAHGGGSQVARDEITFGPTVCTSATDCTLGNCTLGECTLQTDCTLSPLCTGSQTCTQGPGCTLGNFYELYARGELHFRPRCVHDRHPMHERYDVYDGP
jgi:hypothetical protein